MPLVDVFADDDETDALFVADFEFLPRKGEFISIDVDDDFLQLEVVEVWHRQDDGDGGFRACIRVETNE